VTGELVDPITVAAAPSGRQYGHGRSR
jgi:hypothetical protein